MKLKYISMLVLGASLGLTSCNDFLDKEPESNVTPAAFFTAESDLAAYTINLYGVLTSIAPGSYGMGTFAYDNATDNQAATGYSSRWVPGNWKVGQSGGAWDFGNIRNVNYFLDQVLPKYEAGKISGAATNVRHYIGEAYFLRAYLYLDKLQSLGDFPIVLTALPDDKETLVQASKRQPRHKVAQQILDDLDKALELLSQTAPGGKNRISRDAALLLRSRAALFEATWEKYHKGTAFVPGGPGWPGNAEDVKDFNIDSSIDHFLTEAMKSSKELGDKLVGNLVENTDAEEGQDRNLASTNPYYTMFCDKDMSGYSEVIMYRAFDRLKANVTHNIQMQLQRNGGGTGWTRGLVNSFLMRNGLPIYAANSGYDANWENQGIKATLQNRDSRIKIFTKVDNGIENYTDDGVNSVDLSWTVKGNNETRMVTGYAVKKGKNYDTQQQLNHHFGESGSIVFRGTEALLNYMEASWLKSNTIDATADKYWRALRTRAKVDPDYNKTIAATNMQEEAKWDFGAYSHGQLVDATTYNIRRERRNEFIGEGMRWEDLIRWRACDQVNGYQIEGMKYWGTVYEGAWRDGSTNLAMVDVEGGKGNISSKEISGDYIRPYQISKINNEVFDGYKFTPAHYLSPIAQSVFRQTAAGDQTDLNTSVVYQNPGWPKIAGQGPTDVK
ncbi:RagB/SusD family nutrient uptake outer membrane protein [Prevotella stercorea]|uniref:RagB/SusD family nutrient uptake outer membrane protein n=1 Tax=Leyella stercorea TaxID=363265 RepID=UPI001F1A3539|nr:RagB/SusD family nutrient uptake outer membrane protein [Leyella stercorea]MCF2579831.1 RagB/SusD family nutrient uptake outer membrane protein [Leyella stercorea]